MIGNFFDTFQEEKTSKLTNEVVEILEKSLPKGFFIEETENGGYLIVPDFTSDVQHQLRVTFYAEDLKELNEISRERWSEYLYRTQKTIRVRKASVGAEGKFMPMVQTGGNPFLEDESRMEILMKPAEFPPAFPLLVHTGDGEETEIMIRQQPYADLNVTKFENVNFPALKMTLLFDENSRTCTSTCSVTPGKAKSVEEAVRTLRLFLKLYEENLKIPGSQEQLTIKEREDIKMDSIHHIAELWETLWKLEKILDVSFKPREELPESEYKLIEELRWTLIEKNSLSWEHPFDHFHAGQLRMNHEEKDFIGRPGASFEFIEGPTEYTLLDARFLLYSATKMDDLKITGIERQENDEAEIYIGDGGDKPWILRRQYTKSAEEARKIIESWKENKR